MRRVSDILLSGAERFGARLAIADPGESASYEALGRQASQLGRALRALGHDQGERSLIALPNSVAFVRAHFANLLAALVSVPCDATLSSISLQAVAENCSPRILLTDAATLARLTIDGPLPASVRDVVLFGEPISVPEGGYRISWASEMASAQDGGLFDAGSHSGDLAALMYTTGTTGRPKGVPLTHDNVLAALRSISEFVGYTENDREVVILPLSHNFGLGHVYCNLMSGGAVYTENGLTKVGRVLKAIESFGATGFPGTPQGFGLLLDHYGSALAQKARNLRFSVINSAPLPPERTAQLRELLPQLDVMTYYGLTEASRSAFISLSKVGSDLYRSVGQPMRHVELQIRRSDGERADVGGTGEVVIRGPAVPSGYWNNPEETRVVFKDGWLRTGDLGHLDASGRLWITGRIKDVINTGGYKVNPSEVEGVIQTYPGVREAGVVGVSGVAGVTGECVVAAVVLDTSVALDQGALERHCLTRLEKFKAPVRFVEVSALPRTNTGKVKRAELAEAVSAVLLSELENLR